MTIAEDVLVMYAELAEAGTRYRAALEEIGRREARSEYASLAAAPTEFAQLAREALHPKEPPA